VHEGDYETGEEAAKVGKKKVSGFSRGQFWGKESAAGAVTIRSVLAAVQKRIARRNGGWGGKRGTSR